jgi:hypothetical protein
VTSTGIRFSPDLHLPSSSPLVSVHHSNWRNYAAHKIAVTNASGTHYSGVLAIAREDFEKLQDLLLRYLEEAKMVVVESREEEVYCLNLDLLPL